MELPSKLVKQMEVEKAREEKAQAKILATVQYRRRKLDKDVRKYIKSARRINSRSIDEIGRNHGFLVQEIPFREDITPPENA